MPIHQTKLGMAKLQATGMLMPQMPTPSIRRYTTAIVRMSSSVAPRPKTAYQPRGVRSGRTSAQIRSVTERNVRPGATYFDGSSAGGAGGGGAGAVVASVAMRRLQVGVRVAQGGQVGRP